MRDQFIYIPLLRLYYVDFFSEFKEAKESANTLKELIPIGIYGSFKTQNRYLLENLKDCLCKHQYNARMTLDLEKEVRKPKGMRPEVYNNKISELLVRISKIHIIFFFKESEDQHNFNQAATMEIQQMVSSNAKHVLVFFEEGSVEQCSSVLQGLIYRMNGAWEWETFSRQDEASNSEEWLLSHGMQFCLNRIRMIVESSVTIDP